MAVPDRNTADRLVAIESLLMQLQYDLDQLNSAVLAQQAELQQLAGRLHRLAAVIESEEQELPGPADERPPHD